MKVKKMNKKAAALLLAGVTASSGTFVYRNEVEPYASRLLALVSSTAVSEVAARSEEAPGPQVPVAEVVMRKVALPVEFTGYLEATKFVELRPRVGGAIEAVSVPEGGLVEPGKLLFQIDPRPFQVALGAAKAPGIRVGYLVLPPQLVGAFRNLSGLIHRSVPVETQLALAEFIGGGHFASHLRRMRSLYAERRNAFIDAGQTALAGLADIDCSESGLNALAWLTNGREDRAAQRDVLEAGLQCYPLSDYTIATARPNALILGYAGVPAERMRPYLDRFAEALSRS